MSLARSQLRDRPAKNDYRLTSPITLHYHSDSPSCLETGVNTYLSFRSIQVTNTTTKPVVWSVPELPRVGLNSVASGLFGNSHLGISIKVINAASVQCPDVWRPLPRPYRYSSG